MRIVHGCGYNADVVENGQTIASAAFYSDDTLEEIECLKQGDNGLYLAIGLNTEKYNDYDSGCLDFQEEYARQVATMVYEMLLQS